jgi:1-acyl-sn-glycerol-3-phosphate acyltransferase
VSSAIRHIPVDRDAGSQAFRDAVGNLKAGELVGVFPEATMSRSFEIKEIKNGAVRMAAASGTPLIPMIVFGGQRILGYGVKDFSRGKTIAITIGEPIPCPRGSDFDQLTLDLRTSLQRLLDLTIDRYPPAPTGVDAWWLPVRRGGTAPTLEQAEQIDAAARQAKLERRAQTGQ